MVPVLALFLVALVGLPVGKMDGEQRDGQTHLWGQAGWRGWGRKSQ